MWTESRGPPGIEKNSHVESLKLNGVNNPLALIFDTFQSKPWFLVWSGLVLDPFMLRPFSRVIMICMYIYIKLYMAIYIYTYCHPPTRTYLQHHLVVIQYRVSILVCCISVYIVPFWGGLNYLNLPIFIVQQHVCWWTPPWTLQPPTQWPLGLGNQRRRPRWKGSCRWTSGEAKLGDFLGEDPEHLRIYGGFLMKHGKKHSFG